MFALKVDKLGISLIRILFLVDLYINGHKY